MSQQTDDLLGLGVFQVFTGTGTGSGFLIDERHLLTNAHVVYPFREVAVETRSRDRIVGTVRRLHPKRDLAIVELAEALPGQVLKLGGIEPLRQKQRIHILGFPVGLPLSLTEGVVSHPNQRLDDQFFVQTDAAINPGNSGGPMLDDDREVVAVITCKLDAAESVGFGIPVADAARFVADFRSQSDAFGVVCPACEGLIVSETRYCPSCGLDIERDHEIADLFDPPVPDPLTEFVESALAAAGVDPIHARHGQQNWSFHVGSAPVRIWCCCADHVNFSAPLAQTGAQHLDALFAFLLDARHEPMFFDLNGSLIRLNLVVHTADVFTRQAHATLDGRIRDFIAAADALDDELFERFGCRPGPESRATAD